MNFLYSLFNIFRCIKLGDLFKEVSKDLFKEVSKGSVLLFLCLKFFNLFNFKYICILGRINKKFLILGRWIFLRFLVC